VAATGDGDERRTVWARNLAAPVRSYLHAESGAAVTIVVAVAAALLWANLAPAGSYPSFWHTEVAFSIGGHAVTADLRGWINEGLMTLFFLVVGLEAKRELDLGELRERTRLTMPVMASVGGMAAAGGTYLLITRGHAGAVGWGAAVSTDTALALGALTVASLGRTQRVRVFLLTVVVVDDLLALLLIALAYNARIDAPALAGALALFGLLYGTRWLPETWRTPAAALVATGIWLALFESGVDPVVAGLAIGLITGAHPPARDGLERTSELARSFREQPTPALAYSARASMTAAISANERLQYRLHPWTSRVIIPLFAAANTGVRVDGHLIAAAVRSPITWGIVAAYGLGKPLGILGAAWLASRRALGGRPAIVTWPALTGGAAAAGIGFTVSLLVADRAFAGTALDEAKVGVLATALIAPLSAAAAFYVMRHLPADVRRRQLSATAGQLVDLADDVDSRRDHTRGRADAPVTLVEYGDFECPYCGRAEPAVRELLARHGGELRYVFRHLPLTEVHPHAQQAAEAAEAAGAQGAFWPMHDVLFAHQRGLELEDLRRYAECLGLDVERFLDDLRQRRHALRVTEDVQGADASGVSGTPTFFLNGRRHHGAYDLASLTAAVAAAAAAASAADGRAAAVDARDRAVDARAA
jgi:Na+/H+ antiporter NhaA